VTSTTNPEELTMTTTTASPITLTGKSLRPGDGFLNEDGSVDVIVDTFRPKAYPMRVGFVLENGERCTVGVIGAVEIIPGASRSDVIGSFLDAPADYWDARPTSAELDALEGAEEDEHLPEIDPSTGSLLCDHRGETVTRIAHGYLGDAPAGTRQTLCAACGALLEEVRS
jgi:hypothetical protein